MEKLYTFNFTKFGEHANFAICAIDEKSARKKLADRFPDAKNIVLMQARTSNLCR